MCERKFGNSLVFIVSLLFNCKISELKHAKLAKIGHRHRVVENIFLSECPHGCNSKPCEQQVALEFIFFISLSRSGGEMIWLHASTHRTYLFSFSLFLASCPSHTCDATTMTSITSTCLPHVRTFQCNESPTPVLAYV